MRVKVGVMGSGFVEAVEGKLGTRLGECGSVYVCVYVGDDERQESGCLCKVRHKS